jgi:hypothetical protein
MKMNHIKLFWLFSEKLKSQVRQKKYRITSQPEVQHRWSFGGGGGRGDREIVRRKKGFFLELIIKRGILYKEITKKILSHLNKKW